MKTRIAIGVGLAALGVVAATSASAQTASGNPQGAETPPMAQSGLPPRDVLKIVRASGLTPLTQPARRGAHYVVLASDNMGGQLRVTIGADGRILHAGPAHDPRFAGLPVRPRGYVPVAPPYGAAPGSARAVTPPSDLREPSAPLPRTAVRTAPVRAPMTSRPPVDVTQDPQGTSAPDVTGSLPTQAAPAQAAPARTPLPRPRPVVAAAEATPPAAASAAEAAAAAPAPAERPAASPPAPAAKPAPAQPTEMVPVAPLD